MGGMAPAAQGAAPGVPQQIPVAGAQGHRGTSTAGTVCCPCQTEGGRKAARWGGGTDVIHHRLFIRRGHDPRELEGSPEVKFHPAPAATATGHGHSPGPGTMGTDLPPLSPPTLAGPHPGSSPSCWDGHRQAGVSLNLAGILPMTSAQWRLLIVLFGEIISSSPWQPCMGGMPDFFPN